MLNLKQRQQARITLQGEHEGSAEERRPMGSGEQSRGPYRSQLGQVAAAEFWQRL